MVEPEQGAGADDPSRLRISDAERHQVAEVLREAAGEGRLDLDELDERLEATYAARTYADLVPITLDLPTALPDSLSDSLPSSAPHPRTPMPRGSGSAPQRYVAGPVSEQHLAILSGMDRTGVWVVPRQLTIVATMGGADLDLRQARFAAREVTITVNCFMGGAEITVGPDMHVVMGGVAVMGTFQGPRGEAEAAGPDAPVIHVNGVAIMGSVEVKRRR